jgi:Phage Terminase
MLATFAAALAIVPTWWNLGLPRLVFSDEAPIRARIEAFKRCNRDTRLLCSTSPAGAPIPSVTRWMAANVAVAQDPAGNLKPAKDKSTAHIDGIVALIMAIGRALVAQEEPQPFYQVLVF